MNVSWGRNYLVTVSLILENHVMATDFLFKRKISDILADNHLIFKFWIFKECKQLYK